MLVIGFGQGESTVRRSGGALSGSCQKRLAPAIGLPKLSFTVPFTCACKAGEKENRRMAIKLYFISVLYLKK